MEFFLTLAITVFITTIVLLVVFNLGTRASIERYTLTPTYDIRDPLFCRSMSGILAANFIDGNTIRTLIDGEAIFEAMVQDIQSATVSINMESFVWSSGTVCDRLIAALAERARSGVHVHVLLDWMGSNELEDAHYAMMEQAGIQIVKYRKPHWYTLPRLNNRSHRKILVIDGRIGFTGGAGIADQWLVGRHGLPAWKDVHYRIEGPIVANMQAAFLENWLKSHASVLEGESYFPSLQPTGAIRAQLFTSSADGIEAVRLMYLFSIACARHSIRILNAYFVPDLSIQQALIRARKRGVEVDIIVPGENTDQRIVREVSRASWKKLLRKGIRIYEFEPTMHHGKIFIVDDAWVSIGSANCDARSFAINDEMNINMLDERFAQEQIRIFENDKQQSKLVAYDEWKRRPTWGKVVGYCGRILKGQL